MTHGYMAETGVVAQVPVMVLGVFGRPCLPGRQGYKSRACTVAQCPDTSSLKWRPCVPAE